MLRHLPLWSFLLGLIALESDPAVAGNAVPPAPGEAWTGFYMGGHFGYGSGSLGPATNPFPGEAGLLNSSPTGFIGGYQLGYNWQLNNRTVVGLEADVSFPSPTDSLETVFPTFRTHYNYIATVRPRIGYQVGSFLPFITGGFAFGSTRVETLDAAGAATNGSSATHIGWTAGAGLEWPVTGNWTGKFEYDYVSLSRQTYNWPVNLDVDPKAHLFKIGMNYRLNPSKSGATADDDGWSIHGQTTFLPQGYGPFRSPYAGTNSLPGSGMVRETWTVTAFIGRKLWEGGEVYFNPELAQGFGLAHTLGVAGFTNGEAQKAGAEFPRVRAQRYFFRQTFGLGGEQETVEDGPNQLAGKRDIDRVTLTVGRFAVGDFFDNNTYAHDPRADFMNWSIWASAAYDFPADLPGFTRGGVLELNRKNWAVRAGLFQLPNAPGGDALAFSNGGGGVAEFEQRYAFQGQPGKFRIGVFSNRGRTANYREVVATAAATGADINDITSNSRQIREKNGFYANAEQAIGKDLGIFGRVSWADGKNETLSFTDIDQSAAAGLSLKGAQWRRPNDTLGLAGAINGLSGTHKDFFKAGGLGIVVGDGQLNYSPERVLETYYSISIGGPTTLTLDYQFIANPGYNADRGPVSVWAARFHTEF
jgi:high affinity Mn2+ porin